jgi:hypothetical protein
MLVRTLLLGALAASATLGAGIAYADNPNVPPSSRYAVMAPGDAYPAPPPELMSDRPTTIDGYPLGY